MILFYLKVTNSGLRKQRKQIVNSLNNLGFTCMFITIKWKVYGNLHVQLSVLK